jgi:hypothetical protein
MKEVELKEEEGALPILTVNRPVSASGLPVELAGSPRHLNIGTLLGWQPDRFLPGWTGSTGKRPNPAYTSFLGSPLASSI